MPYTNIEELPNDVQEKLPQEAQQIFFTAFNSSIEDGVSEEDAHQIAWNSVKNSYEEDSDGTWHHRPEGGTGEEPSGTMKYA